MSNRKVYKKKSFNMQLMKYNFTYKLTYKDDFYNIACIVSVKVTINYNFWQNKAIFSLFSVHHGWQRQRSVLVNSDRKEANLENNGCVPSSWNCWVSSFIEFGTITSETNLMNGRTSLAMTGRLFPGAPVHWLCTSRDSCHPSKPREKVSFISPTFATSVRVVYTLYLWPLSFSLLQFNEQNILTMLLIC